MTATRRPAAEVRALDEEPRSELERDAALSTLPVSELVAGHALVAEFFASIGLAAETAPEPLREWLEALPEEALLDAGMDRVQIGLHVARLLTEEAQLARAGKPRLETLTLVGGRDKSGRAEPVQLTFRAGEVVCIVGPTGSGKSRLLADIECLAQGDTPTGRRVLVDGRAPSEPQRFSLDRKLVAQLSQNMNFVVDMTVGEFIRMHACCRQIDAAAEAAARVIACANELTGEKFTADVPVTQLSGGQTRALMIADVALLSAAPIVLIDEIENAGVDRRRALELLIRGEKLVLISTHDPLLALRGHSRIVIRNGGIAEVLETSERERRNRGRIEAMDATVMDLRERLRRGERIDADLAALTPSAGEPCGNPALDLLLGRRSCHKLIEPGPGPAELELILRAALRAPDFRQLRPFRFIAAQGQGRERLGAAMQRAAAAGGQPPAVVARAPSMPLRAPLVIVAVASPRADEYAPRYDQELCAASTVLMMQLAARALGYGGVWRSGWWMHSPEFQRELGLSESERIVGFLYLGTPAGAERELPASEVPVPAELLTYV